MNRNISAFVRLQRIAKFCQQSKRLSHNDHHKPFNPGPPITLDYMPIPHQPFNNVYNKLNKKFNFYLFVSSTLFFTSATLLLYYDKSYIDSFLAPKSYRDRNKK